jgi:hypothetical protein
VAASAAGGLQSQTTTAVLTQLSMSQRQQTGLGCCTGAEHTVHVCKRPTTNPVPEFVPTLAESLTMANTIAGSLVNCNC